jgi:hypothetical protein
MDSVTVLEHDVRDDDGECASTTAVSEDEMDGRKEADRCRGRRDD